MPNLQNDKPLQSGFTKQLGTSSDGHESDEATFQLDEDDPDRVENRGGLEVVLANDQNSMEGKLDNNDSTVGLVTPSGQPGGNVGLIRSTSGAIDPQVEMSTIGVVDASVTDLNDANDQPRNALDPKTGS